MQYNKKSVEDIDVSGKKVIVRCDFNVPQDENGNITDDKRIRASLETINYLLSHNAAVILCSHLGRPKGEVNMKYSLAPVAKRLSELLGQEVKLAKDVVGEDAKKLASEVQPATLSCSRTFVSRRARPRMTQLWQRLWPTWLRSTSTTPSAPHTAHTLPPQASLITCRLYAASSSRRRSPSWARL